MFSLETLKIILIVILAPFVVYGIARIVAQAVYNSKSEFYKKFMKKEDKNGKINKTRTTTK